LGESIRSLSHFHIHIAIFGGLASQAIFLNHIVGDIVQFEA